MPPWRSCILIIIGIHDLHGGKVILRGGEGLRNGVLRQLPHAGGVLAHVGIGAVKNFSAESSKSIFQNRDFHDSGGFKNASQDPSKSRCNKTKENDTEMSETTKLTQPLCKMNTVTPFKKTLMLSRGHADFDFFRSLFHRLR